MHNLPLNKPINLRPVIAFDVDLTVVDSLTPWVEWFQKETGLKANLNPSQGLHEAGFQMIDLCKANGIDLDVISWWKKPDIYDDLEPMPGVVDFINRCRKTGNDKIVFVSHCFPEHENGKREFVKRFFKPDGFVSTRDKWSVGYGVIFDDNPEVMRECIEHNKDHALHYLFAGLCPETQNRPRGAPVFYNWNQMSEHFFG